MKNKMLAFHSHAYTCIFFVLALGGCVAHAPTDEEEWPPPRVRWQDEFLGVQPLPVYNQSTNGGGHIDTLGSSQGGALRLWTDGEGASIARVRLGEEPASSRIDSRNWFATEDLDFQARVSFNTNERMQATIGFVGVADPDNVIAALYNTDKRPQWILQVRRDGVGKTKATGFRHVPGEWTTFRIKTYAGDRVELYIQKKLVAVIDDYTPDTGLCMELQLWNRPMEEGSSWTQNMMWVDIIDIRMDRWGM